VPDTTKSVAKTGAPIRSIPDINGVLSAFSPAITGSVNHGPNLEATAQEKGNLMMHNDLYFYKDIHTKIGTTTHLFSYNNVDTKPENISGVISLFSRSLNKLHLNFNNCSTEITSVARPVRPIYSLSVISNTYEKIYYIKLSTIVII
jgi:hypothetical protein